MSEKLERLKIVVDEEGEVDMVPDPYGAYVEYRTVRHLDKPDSGAGDLLRQARRYTSTTSTSMSLTKKIDDLLKES
ncbi:MAG: hypothetical protein KAR40_07990 [Candidatus Sabulitectum sp.]|nr:hypothetical protein [Candidatus Sabulitectum sp.]